MNPFIVIILFVIIGILVCITATLYFEYGVSEKFKIERLIGPVLYRDNPYLRPDKNERYYSEVIGYFDFKSNYFILKGDHKISYKRMKKLLKDINLLKAGDKLNETASEILDLPKKIIEYRDQTKKVAEMLKNINN